MERNVLRGEMLKHGLTQKDAADAMSISVSTFIRKTDEDTFTVKEIRILAGLLGADVVQEIFFNKEKQ